MKAQDLIEELIQLTQKNLNEVQAFKELPMELLNQKPNAKSWSILECIEHLNRYGDFYIPEIKNLVCSKFKEPKSTYFFIENCTT